MSSDIIKEFLVACGFKVDEAQYKKFVGGIENATVKVAALGAATVAMAGVIVHEVDKVADKFNALKNLSNLTKAPVEEIEQWKYAAELTGSTGEAMESALMGIEKAAGSAAAGMKRTVKVFRQVGVDIKDSSGHLKNADELMKSLSASDKFRNLGQGQQLFSLKRLGIDPSLLRTILEDTTAIRQEQADIMNAAGIDGNKAADKAQEYHNQMFRLKYILETIWESVALKVMEKLGMSMDDLVARAKRNLPQIIATLTPVVQEVIDLGGAFLRVGLMIAEAIKPILEFLQWLNRETGGWSSTVLASLFILSRFVGLITAATWVIGALSRVLAFCRTAVLVLNLALYANPIVWFIALVGALIGAIGYLVYAYIKWKNTGVNVFASLGKWWGDWFQDFARGVDYIIEKLGKMWDFMGKVSKYAGTFVTGPQIPSGSAPLMGRGGITQSIHQETKIIVNGAGSPIDTANTIGGHLDRRDADAVRNGGGALR